MFYAKICQVPTMILNMFLFLTYCSRSIQDIPRIITKGWFPTGNPNGQPEKGPAAQGVISASCGQNSTHFQRVKVSRLTIFIHFGAIFSSTRVAISRSFARSALMPPSTISSLWQTQRWEPQEKRERCVIWVVPTMDMGGCTKYIQ